MHRGPAVFHGGPVPFLVSLGRFMVGCDYACISILIFDLICFIKGSPRSLASVCWFIYKAELKTFSVILGIARVTTRWRKSKAVDLTHLDLEILC